MASSALVPAVSVVIPSGRGARLAFALEALCEQSFEGPFEVVVVRDPRAGGAPPAPEGLDMRVIEAERAANIALLRNLGWRAARAPLVAFTDDDCRPTPGWLESLVAAAAEDPGAIVQGPTEPDPDEAHLLHGLARSQRIPGPTAFLQSCNLLIPRAALEAAGGFDERFAALGEDTDLAYRVLGSGAHATFAPGALVWHAVIPRTLPAALREALSRDTMPALVSRHPALREAVYRRVFWKRSHALLLLAGAGLLVARHRPALAAAMAIPYADGVLDAGGRNDPKAVVRRILHLPWKATVDAVEVAVTVRAAARERTFLL